MGLPDILTVTTDYIGRYLSHLRVDSLAKTTISNRKDILVPFFRRVNKVPEDVTLDDIERYLFERALELKPSSLQMEKQALRGFFRYCYEYHEMDIKFRWDVIQRKKVKAPKIKTFKSEDVARVVSNCAEEQDKLIISLMFESGMRIGEIINLQSRDIEGTRIYIRGKGENDRLVFVTETLAKALCSYVVRKGHYKGHIFRPLQRHNNHPNDRYTSAYGVRDRIQRAFRNCGFAMHPHQLRHSFAKSWLMQKGDLRTLQLLLGHADLNTTQRYLGLTDLETQAIYHQVQTTSILVTE